MHLKNIFALFTLLAVPLWALPVSDQEIIARENIPRDVLPTEALQERQLLKVATTGLGIASKMIPSRWVHVFFLLDCSPYLTLAHL